MLLPCYKALAVFNIVAYLLNTYNEFVIFEFFNFIISKVFRGIVWCYPCLVDCICNGLN